MTTLVEGLAAAIRRAMPPGYICFVDERGGVHLWVL